MMLDVATVTSKVSAAAEDGDMKVASKASLIYRHLLISLATTLVVHIEQSDRYVYV